MKQITPRQETQQAKQHFSVAEGVSTHVQNSTRQAAAFTVPQHIPDIDMDFKNVDFFDYSRFIRCSAKAI